MRRVHCWLKRAEGWALGRFTHWFVSQGGVYQTLLVVMAVVGVEAADRGLDPHAFMLMAILTVYSAITQPALAYSNERSAELIEARLARIERALGIDQ